MRTLDIFITRHGKCVHNSPENEHLWRLNNDDIMGLTAEGIADTCLRASMLSKLLHHEENVTLLHTQSVRSYQTCSLLMSQLVQEHGFDHRMISMVEAPAVFCELPRPTMHAPIPKDWKFQDFKSDPNYKRGDLQSFSEKVDEYANLLGLWASMPFIPPVCNAAVFVGHHYSLNAFLCAVAVKILADQPSEVKKKAVALGQKYYFHHDEALMVSGLLNSAGLRVQASVHRKAQEAHARRIVNKNIISASISEE